MFWVTAQLPVHGDRVTNEEALLSEGWVGQSFDASVPGVPVLFIHSPGQNLPSVMHAQLSLTSVKNCAHVTGGRNLAL